MEIVLAVLLFFGGFTLGSITAGNEGDESQSTMAMPNADGVPGSHPVTPALRQSDPTRCHSDRSVIYRDLTLPTFGQTGQPTAQADDCDGECQNE